MVWALFVYTCTLMFLSLHSRTLRTLAFALALAGGSLLASAHQHSDHESVAEQHPDSCLACYVLHTDIDANSVISPASAATPQAWSETHIPAPAHSPFHFHRARAPPVLS